MLDAGASEMNQTALQELPSSLPQFSFRPVDPLADNASQSAPDLCTVTLQSLAQLLLPSLFLCSSFTYLIILFK